MRGVVNSREGKTTYMSYVVNGNEYKYGYYLGDGYIQTCGRRRSSRTLEEVSRSRNFTPFAAFSGPSSMVLGKWTPQSRGQFNYFTTFEVSYLLVEVGQRELTKLCAYIFQFWYQVLPLRSPTHFSRVLEIQNCKTDHNLHHDLTEHIWERQFQGENDDEDEENEDGDDEVDEDGDDDE
uniref:Uncharacterized protein n=1 Tax=Lactuca sativa TaxID=4236 RepID=A0A9R1WQR8_LACSA|nr:hypothetical protein LSAT_V11C100002490 [Lactuca sativa]